MSGESAASEALKRLDRGLFVGRARELELLGAAKDETQAGHGRVVLVAGEPGIGKSSLIKHALAPATPFMVLTHTCDAGQPAFWPWRAVVAERQRHRSTAAIRAEAAAVSALFSQPRHARPARDVVPVAARARSEEKRFALFDRVVRFLRVAAARQPLLIKLEDLHCADIDSLQLLYYCAQQLGDVAVLIVGTYRPHELSRTVAALLAEIGQRRPNRELVLQGLSELEVRELVETIAGHTCASTFSRELFTLTEGNPLYLEELLRQFLSQGVLRHDGVRWVSQPMPRDLPIPPSLEEVLWQRCAGLSGASRRLLNAASVIGREIDVATVGRLTGMDTRKAAAGLKAMQAKHLIARRADGTYRFHHHLFREVLHNRLTPAIRAGLHLRYGTMLEKRYGRSASRHAAELAYHFSEATSAAGCEKAVSYALRAADAARQVMGYDEGARTLEAAARILDRTPRVRTRLNDVLLPLAAALWRSGRFDRARQVSLRAVEVARRAASPELLARAALSYAGQLQGFGAVAVDQTTAALLREALRVLPPRHTLQPLLMARLAEELAFSESDEQGRSLGQEAIGLARRRGNPSVLAATLKTTHWALWTPEGVHDRLARGDEIVALANASGDQSLGFNGELVRVWAFFELGDRPGVEDALRACRGYATSLHEPYPQWLCAVTETCHALMTGRIDRVEVLARHALQVGDGLQDPNCLLFYNGQMAHLCWLTGRFADLPRYYSDITDPHPLLVPTVSCARASMFCEMGRMKEARAEFEQWARERFSSVPRNPTWLFTMAIWSRVCAVLGDTQRAEYLYEVLIPFQDRNVVLVPFFATGAVAYFLGLLAATLERWDAAERHYESALAMNVHMGTTQWVARTQVAYAAMLMRRRRSDDGARARVLLEEAVGTSEAMGMPPVAQQARARLKQLATDDGKRSPTSRPQPTPRPSQSSAMFLQIGDCWRAVFEGRECYFRDLRGFRYLRELLASPNKPVNALELVWTARPPDGPEEHLLKDHVWAFAHAYDPLLDGRTLFEIFRELAGLRTQLADARVQDDQAGITDLSRTIAELRSCIRRACRPDGTSQAYVTALERARQIVQKGKRSVIEAVGPEMPAFACHVSRYVRTGRYCCYIEDPTRPIAWEL